MSNFEDYKNRVEELKDNNEANKRVEFLFPEYLYRMIEETAERDNTSKTAALAKLVHIGDMVDFHTNHGDTIIVRDAEDVNHIINFQ